MPDMKLWKLQDVGGLRAVMGSPAEAAVLAESLVAQPPPRFQLLRRKNYIELPKASGYRGIHLVYSYLADADDDPKLNGLTVELQVRSQMQHTWATSVEIVGTFRREPLKSGEGNPEWLRFFTLAGALIASKEGTTIGPDVSADQTEFHAELAALRTKLRVFDRSTAYNITDQIKQMAEVDDARYFVLTFELKARRVTVAPFIAGHFTQAIAAYRTAERDHLGDDDVDTVLVGADSVEQLVEAYPNYFGDTRNFLDLVCEGMRSGFSGAESSAQPYLRRRSEEKMSLGDRR